MQIKILLELYSSSERPNWYQRVRLAIGIIEFFSDTWHYQDTDQHLYLCQPLIKSFGYDKDYESKVSFIYSHEKNEYIFFELLEYIDYK